MRTEKALQDVVHYSCLVAQAQCMLSEGFMDVCHGYIYLLSGYVQSYSFLFKGKCLCEFRTPERCWIVSLASRSPPSKEMGKHGL